MPLTWNDSLSVGISIIDEQHQNLVQMINGLHSALKEEHSPDTQGAMMRQLVVYAKEHFATEEELLNHHQYPEAESHVQSHRKLLQRVTGFMNELENENSVTAIKLCLFLGDWLENHLRDDDQKYFQFFKSHGIA